MLATTFTGTPPTITPALTVATAKSLDHARAACLEAVLTEFNPVGFSETLLASEVARQAAEIVRRDRLSASIDAAAEGALTLLMLPTSDKGRHGESTSDAVFLGEDFEKASHAQHRAADRFYRLVTKLADLQRQRNYDQAGLQAPDPRFASEIQCITYLARRFRMGNPACRLCHEAGSGSWIASRQLWECSRCHTQTGIRHRTVMARSQLPLVAWFHAIHIILHVPTIAPSDLATSIKVRRLPTVRGMKTKIRSALVADNVSQLLAGLDQVYFPEP